MVISVTTTSQDLLTIFSTGQEALAESMGSIYKPNNSRKYAVAIQNLGATDIYLEFGQAATTANGWKISATGGVGPSFDEFDLSQVNLISDTSTNADIRVIINNV